jgi:hypothetical protein
MEVLMAGAAGNDLYPAISSHEAGVHRLSAVDGTRTIRSSMGASGRMPGAPCCSQPAHTFVRHRELAKSSVLDSHRPVGHVTRWKPSRVVSTAS